MSREIERTKNAQSRSEQRTGKSIAVRGRQRTAGFVDALEDSKDVVLAPEDKGVCVQEKRQSPVQDGVERADRTDSRVKGPEDTERLHEPVPQRPDRDHGEIGADVKERRP